jgi:hypothetical protein
MLCSSSAVRCCKGDFEGVTTPGRLLILEAGKLGRPTMRKQILVLLSAGLMLSGGAAIAAPAKMTTTKTVTTKPAPAAPRKLSGAAATAHAKKVAASQSKVVTTKTASGKTVRYDCGKAGNKNKKACG